jgi:starch synthase (maltosyl-transferring)
MHELPAAHGAIAGAPPWIRRTWKELGMARKTRSAATGAVTAKPRKAVTPKTSSNGAPERATSPRAMDPRRVLIEHVRPSVDGGRYPVKRTAGEALEVRGNVFCDGHDTLAVVLRHRRAGGRSWEETPMRPLGNDVWTAAFDLEAHGEYEYMVEAWVDRFATWRHALEKKAGAGQIVASELLEGAALVRAAAGLAKAVDRRWLEAQAELLAGSDAQDANVTVALDEALAALMARLDARTGAVQSQTLRVRAERERARYGAWYEIFPRSARGDGVHATLREAAKRLPEIAAMGFDVVYLPPVHPIGRAHRKGPNNTLQANPGDPGSPWAIGAAEGGHKAVHPDLGTLDDFDGFVAAAKKAGLEIALDIAFQCSPDHPYVSEHPEWFRRRPDGSIKYAENPPKKYQDIYPFDFECEDWRALWAELASIVAFWLDHGVRVFRVDNPHTKPFRFWEWLIAEIQEKEPGAIFLSEAFTRPRVMHALAKAGFTQSYTYFTWRNTKQELTEYFTELTQTDVREAMRPNLFANTPDILHEYLQFGGRPAFMSRLVLAATLGATYGIYGPVFELCYGVAVPGTEEYMDSEKYQVRRWDRNEKGHIRDLIALVNQARREQPALQYDHSLRFHPVSNEQLIAYTKASPDLKNVVLTVVNLDPHHVQDGWVSLPLHEFGIAADEPFQVHDVIGDARYLWNGEHNYVRLEPHACPAHVFVVRRRLRTEKDFDYYQ